jgi:hypothetical protein
MNSFIPSVTVNGETFQPDPTFTTSAEEMRHLTKNLPELYKRFGPKTS